MKRTLRRWSGVALVGTMLLSLSAGIDVAVGASAVSVTYSVPLPSRATFGPWPAPDGGFSFVACSPTKSFTRYRGDGTQIVSATLEICPADVTYGPDGVAYVVGSDPLGELIRIDLLGHQSVLHTWSIGGPSEVEFGSDGNLYVKTGHDNFYYLQSVDPSTGVAGDEVTLNPVGGVLAARPGVVTYANSVAIFVSMLNPSAPRTELPQPTPGPRPSFGTAVSVAPDGTAWLLYQDVGNGITIPPNDLCTDVILSRISVDGLTSWSNNLASIIGTSPGALCKPMDVSGSPDGGAVIAVRDGSGALTLAWVDKTGGLNATATPTFGLADGLPTTTSLQVDGVGRVVVASTVQSACDINGAFALCSEIDVFGYDRGVQIFDSAIQGASNDWVKLGTNTSRLSLIDGAVVVGAEHGITNQGGDSNDYRLDVITAPVQRQWWRDPTPPNLRVGSPSVVPDDVNVSVAGVWPSPDGTHMALFNDLGPQHTYIARLSTNSVRPYPALQVPGGFAAATFGPDSTAYIAGADHPGSAIQVGQLLRVRPGASSAEILHQWPRGQNPFSIEYIGEHLYVAVVTNAYDCSLTLQELDLDGNEIGSMGTGVNCGVPWRATTNLLSTASHFGVFQFFDPTTLTPSTYNLPLFDAAEMGRDGAWSVLSGGCSTNTHLVRLDRNGATLLDQPLGSVAPSPAGRCDAPGVAVMSDLTTAVGFYDAVGVLHVYLVPPTGGARHLTDIVSTEQGVQAQFATDDNGHLVIAHEQTVTCQTPQGASAACEQISVDTYSAAGLVASSVIGGTYGDSEILVRPPSVDDGSIALSILRSACIRGCFFGDYQQDIRVVSAPVLRETWHDPAALAEPAPDQLSLTATPSTQVVASDSVLSARLQTASGQAIQGTSVRFQVMSGPDTGFIATVATDATGISSTPLKGGGVGVDQIQAWIDDNTNGVADPGELIATTAVTWVPPNYVALGDSYSSGEGAAVPPVTSGSDANFYLSTDTSNNRCHRSHNAYPDLLKRDLSVTTYGFHACSGALLSEMTNQLGKDNPNPRRKKFTGQWDEPAQLDHLLAPTTGPPKPNTSIDLVTLSIGGNDAGFAEAMSNCVSGLGNGKKSECTPGFLQSQANRAVEVFKNGLREKVWSGGTWDPCVGCGLGAVHYGPRGAFVEPDGYVVDVPSVHGLLQQIHELAPNAKIRLLLYPKLFPKEPPKKCIVGQFQARAVTHSYTLDYATMVKLNDLADQVDDTLTDEVKLAQRGGISAAVVDPRVVFAPHGVACIGDPQHSTSDPWINGALIDGSVLLPKLASASPYSFHPNTKGQQVFETAVRASL